MDGKNVYKENLPQEGILVLGNEANGISKNIENLIAECLREASNMPRENLVTYRNLYPNQKHKAILSVDELGYNSFKFAKQT